MAEKKKATSKKVTKDKVNKDKWATTGGSLKPVNVKKIVWDKH